MIVDIWKPLFEDGILTTLGNRGFPTDIDTIYRGQNQNSLFISQKYDQLLVFWSQLMAWNLRLSISAICTCQTDIGTFGPSRTLPDLPCHDVYLHLIQKTVERIYYTWILPFSALPQVWTIPSVAMQKVLGIQSWPVASLTLSLSRVSIFMVFPHRINCEKSWSESAWLLEHLETLII